MKIAISADGPNLQAIEKLVTKINSSCTPGKALDKKWDIVYYVVENESQSQTG